MAPPRELQILPQPDQASCGPTCLHAVYRWFGDPMPLERIIAEVKPLSTGGTLAVDLARHALRRGYAATIYTYNLEVFDPTWFRLPGIDLAERLGAQARAKPRARLREATVSYLDFLGQGGTIRHEELNTALLQRLLAGGPVITGLSATYLYGCAREVGDVEMEDDDIRGRPQGHFVVLGRYDAGPREVWVADPLEDRPGFESHVYRIGVERVLGAILLGALTYDANLAVIRPTGRNGARRGDG